LEEGFRSDGKSEGGCTGEGMCKILVHQVSMIGSQIEYWTWAEDGKKKVKG
jgi:hypothetical protein